MYSAKQVTPGSACEDSTDGPIRILEIELSQALPDIASHNADTGQVYRKALLLVRLCHQPLSMVELRLGEEGIKAVEYADSIWLELGPRINEYLSQCGLPNVKKLTPKGIPHVSGEGGVQISKSLYAETPAVSVVVATHDRTESLSRCLRSLTSLDYPAYEIVVVDNAPSSTTTADFIRSEYGGSPLVRYLREDLPGLGAAHNCGLSQITNPIVAFTDDDVVVDQCWLHELARGFSLAEDVACVTGMIFPKELETQCQVWTEQYWGLCKGFTTRVFDLDQNRLSTPLYPYTAGVFGSGANMAFRTPILKQMGGFDNALGVGTIARGGDDLAAFLQVISNGYKLVYQPSAIIHHLHRRDYEGLRRQAFGYGVGLTAYLCKSVIDRPDILLNLISRAPTGLSFIFGSGSDEPKCFPKELKYLERKGMLYGPIAYLRSRWERRNVKIPLEIKQDSSRPNGTNNV